MTNITFAEKLGWEKVKFQTSVADNKHLVPINWQYR